MLDRCWLAAGSTGLAAGLLVASLPGCPAETVVEPSPVCTPFLASVAPASGPVEGGTEAMLVGLWMITDDGVRDVRIRVGGVDATVVSVARTGCEPCDRCSTEALRCQECDRVCRGETGYSDPATGVWSEPSACVESASFVTPPGDEGNATIVFVSGRGLASGPGFRYEAGGDDDSGDDDSGDDDSGDDVSGR
jgi:hypothetical protein